MAKNNNYWKVAAITAGLAAIAFGSFKLVQALTERKRENRVKIEFVR